MTPDVASSLSAENDDVEPWQLGPRSRTDKESFLAPPFILHSREECSIQRPLSFPQETVCQTSFPFANLVLQRAVPRHHISSGAASYINKTQLLLFERRRRGDPDDGKQNERQAAVKGVGRYVVGAADACAGVWVVATRVSNPK